MRVSLNERGERVLSGNRSVRSVEERGGKLADDEPAPHVLRALDAILSARPSSVGQLAASLGVMPSTAWGYVCSCVAISAEAREHAAEAFLYPPLLSSLLQIDAKGTLRDVMARLERDPSSPLSGDAGWRCELERYSQLRCARLCLGM